MSPAKPIVLNPANGSVTLHLSPGVWRWIADAVRLAIAANKEFDASDFATFFDHASGFLDSDDLDVDEVGQAAAVVVCGLAALGRGSIGRYLGYGLPFGSPYMVVLEELERLASGPLFQVNDGKSLNELAGGDALASVLVEVVS